MIKLTKEQYLHLQSQTQKATIKILVELIDELRQPFNNSSRHELYLKATSVLNKLEEEERI